jgi:hypothetical protein
MDSLLALILSCSLHHDDALVNAFIQRASDGNPYFVVDVPTLSSHDHVQTREEALALVADIEKHGGRPAIGLMAIPVTWAARYGRPVGDLFDACVNISVGTDVMAAYAAECGKPTARLRGRASTRNHPSRPRRLPLAAERVCILRHFDTELNVQGFPQAVLAMLAKISATLPDTTMDSPPARSAAFPDGTDESDARDRSDWSSPRFFFTPPPAPLLPVATPDSRAAPARVVASPPPAPTPSASSASSRP